MGASHLSHFRSLKHFGKGRDDLGNVTNVGFVPVNVLPSATSWSSHTGQNPAKWVTAQQPLFCCGNKPRAMLWLGTTEPQQCEHHSRALGHVRFWKRIFTHIQFKGRFFFLHIFCIILVLMAVQFLTSVAFKVVQEDESLLEGDYNLWRKQQSPSMWTTPESSSESWSKIRAAVRSVKFQTFQHELCSLISLVINHSYYFLSFFGKMLS